ncbi:MAG: nicotinamide-nucleotide amidohydrolase family protein [Actinomycetota bacterium]
MDCTILSVGTELSLGLVLDTNSRFIADKITSYGIECNFIHIVRDNKKEISEVLKLSLGQSDIVIINGGLGPTDDDLTRNAVAEAAGLKLERIKSLDQTSLKFIKKIKSKEIEKRLLRQSYIPRGAVPFKPRLGSASGFVLQYGDKWIFSIPGVPREMSDMLLGDVVPVLEKIIRGKTAKPGIKKRVLMTTDISETEIETKIKDLVEDANRKKLNIGITANPGLIKIILISRKGTQSELDYFEHRIRQRLKECVYGIDEVRIGYHLKDAINKNPNRLSISTAESVTGGLIGTMITDVPGSSDYYSGGLISYSNFSKINFLGVNQKTIEQKGAVSGEVCAQMSEGIKRIFGSDYALAVTGYAGPEDEDTGLIYLGIRGPGDLSEVTEKKFLGSREDIKFRTAQFAINRLRVLITNGR